MQIGSYYCYDDEDADSDIDFGVHNIDFHGLRVQESLGPILLRRRLT
jgi:hypothetical protein